MHHRKRSPFVAALVRLESGLLRRLRPYPGSEADHTWNSALELAMEDVRRERREVESYTPQKVRRRRCQVSREEENQAKAGGR